MNRDDLALALRVVATEAAEEPNAIVGHPEIFDALDSVASDDQLVTCFESTVPGIVDDPAAFIQALSGALATYRDAPLDDAPEIVEGLAFLSWVVDHAGAPAAQAPDTPALALV